MRVMKGLIGLLLAMPLLASAEEIGQVSTVFKFVGPNDRIVVEAFDDPKVDGVTCYLSRAKTGGVKGGLGLAEDRAEASIACRHRFITHGPAQPRPGAGLAPAHPGATL